MKTVLTLWLLLALCAPVAAESIADVSDLYMHERYGDAAALCGTMLEKAPGDPVLTHLNGRILADLYDFATAVPYLEHGLTPGAPAWVPGWSSLYLGICALNTGDTEAARRHWNAVISGSSTANATDTASLYRDGCLDGGRHADWIARDTEHFEFRFSPSIEGLDFDAYANKHELAHTFIATWCDAGEDRPIRYFVWDSKEEMFAAGLRTPGFNRARVSLVHVRRDQSIGHEMAHVLSLRTHKPTYISGLIAEGLAVFLDMNPGSRLEAARDALRDHGEPVTVDALWNEWWTHDPHLAYAVAGAFVEMLVDKGGRERFLELFVDMDRENARRVYGDDLDGWITEFETSLTR